MSSARSTSAWCGRTESYCSRNFPEAIRRQPRDVPVVDRSGLLAVPSQSVTGSILRIYLGRRRKALAAGLYMSNSRSNSSRAETLAMNNVGGIVRQRAAVDSVLPDRAGPGSARLRKPRHATTAAPSDGRSRASGCRRRRDGRRSWGLYSRHCEPSEAIHHLLSSCGAVDCSAEPVIGRAFARPVGSHAENYAATTSSLTTKNFVSVMRPKLVVSATSAASRPVPIRMRPMRGWLWRASNVYHWPDR